MIDRPSYKKKQGFSKFGMLQSDPNLNMHKPKKYQKTYNHRGVKSDINNEELEQRDDMGTDKALYQINEIKKNLSKKSALKKILKEPDEEETQPEIRISKSKKKAPFIMGANLNGIKVSEPIKERISNRPMMQRNKKISQGSRDERVSRSSRGKRMSQNNKLSENSNLDDMIMNLNNLGTEEPSPITYEEFEVRGTLSPQIEQSEENETIKESTNIPKEKVTIFKEHKESTSKEVIELDNFDKNKIEIQQSEKINKLMEKDKKQSQEIRIEEEFIDESMHPQINNNQHKLPKFQKMKKTFTIESYVDEDTENINHVKKSEYGLILKKKVEKSKLNFQEYPSQKEDQIKEQKQDKEEQHE